MTRREYLFTGLAGAGLANHAPGFRYPVRRAEERRPRVALVIGNENYADKKAHLNNPINDARAVKSALDATGFKAVLREDVDETLMKQLVADFLVKISGDTIALFYYSGHGMQIGGENYLLPIDVSRDYEHVVKRKSVALGDLLNGLSERNPALSLVVLDACRDNPFGSSRSLAEGLAGVSNPPGASVIFYATTPGKTAADNPRGIHSPFTSALLDVITRPGLRLDDMFDKISEKVVAETKGDQSPVLEKSGGASALDFYFVPSLQVASDLITRPSRKTEPKPIHTKWALCVGIGHFADEIVTPLEYASKDARDFAHALTDPEIGRFAQTNVSVLLDNYATTQNIRERLIWLSEKATADDGVVLHFSAHGIGRRLTTAEVNYIVTYDTQLASATSLGATALPLAEIAEFIHQVAAERVLLVLDVGNAQMPWVQVNSQQITTNRPTNAAVEHGHVAILASSPGEGSWESSQYENSMLMHFLLEGMRSTRGNISSLELFNYVSTRVAAATQREFQRAQHPALKMAGEATRFELGQAAG